MKTARAGCFLLASSARGAASRVKASRIKDSATFARSRHDSHTFRKHRNKSQNCWQHPQTFRKCNDSATCSHVSRTLVFSLRISIVFRLRNSQMFCEFRKACSILDSTTGLDSTGGVPLEFFTRGFVESQFIGFSCFRLVPGISAELRRNCQL